MCMRSVINSRYITMYKDLFLKLLNCLSWLRLKFTLLLSYRINFRHKLLIIIVLFVCLFAFVLDGYQNLP